MKIHNVHERSLPATPEDVTALFADMLQLWPSPERAPKPEGDLLRVGPMLWQGVERPGAVLAYDIVGPPDLRGSHWFEVDATSSGGSRLRHPVEGEAVGDFEPVWRDRIEPMHDLYIEAIFDRAESALA